MPIEINNVQEKIISFDMRVRLLKLKKGIWEKKLSVLKKYISKLNTNSNTIPFNNSPTSQYDFQSLTFPSKKFLIKLLLIIILFNLITIIVYKILNNN